MDDSFEPSAAWAPVRADPTFKKRFLLRREIGAGGMGSVLAAEDRELSRMVALKQCHGSSPQDRARLQSEAKLLGKISHPCIVKLFSLFNAGAVPVLVMELVDGISMRSADRGPDLPLDMALRWLDLILDGLTAAHAVGILHRDLKPDNILLPREGGLKLVDFGLAKQVANLGAGETAHLTSAGTLLGTPEFMSPEQCRGEKLHPTSDIYQVGVIGFWLLSGRLPFEGENPVELISRHLYTPPPNLTDLVPGLPRGLDALIQRALAKQPADRYPDCPSFRAALAEYLPERSTGAMPTVSLRSSRTGPSARLAVTQVVKTPSRTPFVLAGAVLLMLLVIGRFHQRTPMVRPSPPSPRPAIAAKSKSLTAGGEQYIRQLAVLRTDGKAAQRTVDSIRARTKLDYGRDPLVYAGWIEVNQWLTEGGEGPADWTSNASAADTFEQLNRRDDVIAAKLTIWATDLSLNVIADAFGFLHSHPTDARGWLHMGRIMERDERPDAALHCYRKGLQLLKKEPIVLKSRSVYTGLARALSHVPGYSLEADWIPQVRAVQELLESGKQRGEQRAAWQGLVEAQTPPGLEPARVRRLLEEGAADATLGQEACLVLAGMVQDKKDSEPEPEAALAVLLKGANELRVNGSICVHLAYFYLERGQLRQGEHWAKLAGLNGRPILASISQLPDGPLVDPTPFVRDHSRSDAKTVKAYHCFRLLEEGKLPAAVDVGADVIHDRNHVADYAEIQLELAGAGATDDWIRQGVEGYLLGYKFQFTYWEMAAGTFTNPTVHTLMFDYLAKARKRYSNDPGVLLVHALWLSRCGDLEGSLKLLEPLLVTGCPEVAAVEILTRPMWLAALGDRNARRPAEQARRLRLPMKFETIKRYMKQMEENDLQGAGRSAATLAYKFPSAPYFQLVRLWAARLRPKSPDLTQLSQEVRYSIRRHRVGLWALRTANTVETSVSH